AAPRPDFEALAARLEPFWRVLPRRPAPAAQNTLAALAQLGDLRNRTLGHGAVGWALALEPFPFLAAAHGHLLQTLRPLAGLDFGVYAWRGDELVARDRGVELAGTAGLECTLLSYLAGDDLPVALNPFAAFSDDRLYLLHRFYADPSPDGPGDTPRAEYENTAPLAGDPAFATSSLPVDDFFDADPEAEPA
ncbi:MAG TPA: hypothetical protein VF541_02980, partial [Longimicrobium sp.]